MNIFEGQLFQKIKGMPCRWPNQYRLKSELSQFSLLSQTRHFFPCLTNNVFPPTHSSAGIRTHVSAGCTDWQFILIKSWCCIYSLWYLSYHFPLIHHHEILDTSMLGSSVCLTSVFFDSFVAMSSEKTKLNTLVSILIQALFSTSISI